MAKFEVHIPASEPGGFNMTLKVGAENWMSALKAGMQKLGEQGAISQNVMVDIQDDNSVHVTEALSGRVFRIRELSEDEASRAQVKRPSQIIRPPSSTTNREAAKTDPGGGPGHQTLIMGAPAIVSSQEAKTLPPTQLPAERKPTERGPLATPGAVPTQPDPAFNSMPTPAPPPAPPPATGSKPKRQKVESRGLTKSSPRMQVPDVEELVQPIKPVTGAIGRPRSSPSFSQNQRVSTEDMLADIFLRVVELDRVTSLEEAMNFVIDLAMEKVPCESGSVLRADGTSGDLTFITARGPKAKQLMASNLVIPAGAGIAGFCSSEGVSVAVSDVEKDPRFYSGVAEKVDYETKSILCAPMMTHGRSFGCMQLINRRGGPQFQEHEVGVLAYLAHQAALFMNNRLLE
jgi:hypothetical protein